ncbi:unnamed protein product [Linum trigynum]|uniref:KIB1-4 beta-propeller domain-containing protein n=1 Tax=Linum trigynum TaxID=586398 RepID=A0AAV2DPR5_9ROSI
MAAPNPKKQKTTTADEVGWESLPHDLLIAVATRLRNLSTNIRFTGVCRSWRVAGLPDRRRLIGRQIPGLLLPRSDNSLGGTREFIQVTAIVNKKKKKKTKRRKVVPCRLRDCWSLCSGSVRGWILLLDSDLRLVLANPATGSQVALPGGVGTGRRIKSGDFPKWGFWHSRRVTIWAPSAKVSDWFVFVMLPGPHWKTYIKYCRVGAGRGWAVMEFPGCRSGVGFIVDALCSSLEAGYLYVLISTGELFRCNFAAKVAATTTTTRVVESSQPLADPFKSGPEFNYLVEVEGQILVLHRNRESQGSAEVYCRTRGFDVYGLDGEGKRWVEIKEIGVRGDFAVFLGFGQPFSIPADAESGIRGNCIYVLEVEQYGCRERCCIGVFDLKTSNLDFFLAPSAFEEPYPGIPVRLPIPLAPVPW